MSHQHYFPLALVFALALNACKEKKFAADAGARPSPSPACTAPHATQVRLLTAETANGKAGNFIEYALSVVDCSGRPQPIVGEALLFDIDGVSPQVGLGEPLSFIAATPTEQVTGQLLEIAKTDLFGRTGDEYFHNRSDQPLNFKTPPLELRLRIDLGGRQYHLQAPGSDLVAPLIPTFLRYGQAQPVQADVIFRGDLGGGLLPSTNLQ